MPAIAKLKPTPGARTRKIPATKPAQHSFSCNARSPPWPATREAEHAVSCAVQGPCIPRTYESRPAPIDEDAPVAPYTLVAAGEAARSSPNSEPIAPMKTPVPLPLREARSNAA
eukprot:1724817-Prymnesium_polylepis.2